LNDNISSDHTYGKWINNQSYEQEKPQEDRDTSYNDHVVWIIFFTCMLVSSLISIKQLPIAIVIHSNEKENSCFWKLIAFWIIKICYSHFELKEASYFLIK